MSTQQAAQPGKDPVSVDAKHYSVEVDNEKVRVLRVKYGPGEKSSMHSHPPLIAIMLTDSRLRFTYPDGRTEEISGSAGQILNMPATDHLPENIGDQPFEGVLVELKG